MKALFSLIAVLFLVSCAASSHSSAMKQGIEKTKLAVANCVEKREAGAFKTYAQTALCGNNAIEQFITPHTEFPALVKEYTDYRLAVAKQTDAGKIGYDEGQALVDAKGKALEQQAMEMQEQIAQQEFMVRARKEMDERRRMPFGFGRCQFDKFGTPRCSSF